MAPAWFAKGLILGFSIAAPVGPIGVLCIKTSLTQGRGRGLAVGLGAATADAFYGAIAAFGLTALSQFLVGARLWLQLGGGVFLLYLGWKAWKSGSGGPQMSPAAEAAGRGFHKPGADRPIEKGEPVVGLYASSVGLTLTNPMTILSFIAIFAAMKLAGAPGHLTAAFLVAGVFFGSAAWWVILSSSAGWIGKTLGGRTSGIIARASAAVLLGFGAAALATAWPR